MWKGQIEALSKHHKLILWDMRSRGRSAVNHRDAAGLAHAARGMLTQRDAA